MGGTGGRGGLGSRRDRDELRREAEEELRSAELQAEVMEVLSELLSELNDRDVDAVGRYLEEIADAIADAVDEFETLLYGGSVAKHTYVDGISDVDSLVVLDMPLSETTPAEMLAEFADTLRAKLNMSKVESVDVGALAVTISYTDGTEVQLLPALRDGDGFAIGSASGTEWQRINPRAFAARLTEVNQECGRIVVPTIKLAKSAMQGLPDDARLSGYHVEAIAVEAFQDYSGPRNPMAAARHLLSYASQRVLSPISDPTGQSSDIGSWLGEANSEPRQAVSRRLARIATALESAQSGEEWRRIISPDE